MMTNAQAALLAACTQFAGAEVDADPGTVQGVAAKYKGWLDRKDREEKEYLAQQSTTPTQTQYTGLVLNRHVDGQLPPGTCPVCGAAPGEWCTTDTRRPLLHGHALPVE